MKKIITSAVTSLFLLAGSIYASDAKASDADIEKVRAELSKMIPAATDADIVSTEAEGVYRLGIQGSFAYAYVAGDHILIGDLYNSKTKDNLGDVAQAEFLSKELDSFKDKMIVFGPKDAKHHITVFTDIDCGYCRKLHQEVPDLTKAGVQVRYLAFPRAGVGSESYKKYVSVWCNDDPQKALTDAKSGRFVEPANCDNPIADTYNLGRQSAVSGTPTIIFADGTRAPGYLPSAQLLGRMGISSEGAE
ncbi:bifunctional protein-disulfide isomerase/oxidoreductase DsbC [Arenicella sp. 4NH20-0111]|uniref:DsbC family protein n=1 Tax=Arenicella sp. 4NH20-0111 TaxID=3127648 RepID=UPI003104F15A